MVKIGIVTVYNTPNCGSYLQAYAMQKFLHQKGHEVYFLKNTINIKRRWYYRLLQISKYLLKGDILTVQELTTPYKIFSLLQKKFSITNKTDDLDLIIYGSDVIWNIADSYILNNWKRFFGYGVETKKISYAASSDAAKADAFKKIPQASKCLAEFSGLGVRDIPTKEIVNSLLPEREDVQQVVDPTMLLTHEDFEEIFAQCPEKDFVLVYYFGKIPEELVHNMRAFAKEKNKKIVAFGNCPWADVTLPFDPRLMLGYYKNADFVVTNTFHGNIFSILFGKQFVSFGKQKRKVAALLEEFGLSSRLLDETENIDKHLLQLIDYETIERTLEKKREVSYRYLEKFLNV